MSGMLSRLHRIFFILRLRGIGYPLRLLRKSVAPRLAGDLLLRTPLDRLLPRRRPSAPERTLSPEPNSEEFVQAERWLPEETWSALSEDFANEDDVNEPRVLGRIDNDGRLSARYGPVPGFEEIADEDFVERYRYDLDLVVEVGNVLVRKKYRGDRQAFLREWTALERLDGGAAPALYRADEEGLRLWKALLPGSTLRQHLVEAGARILSVDTEGDPSLQRLAESERIEAVWRRGREHFGDLPPGTIEALERQLDAVHRQGVTGFSLTFGNVVLVGPRLEPRFLDFDAAEVHPRAGGLRFHLARDRDRRIFARIYDRDLVTEESAREILRRLATPYSPIDLGRGLATRGFWSVDSGSGRWEIFNGPVLRGFLEGRRVLDLGSFNALNPLLMLSDGAREVVAVERSPEMIPLADDLHRLFEWRDMRDYALDLRCADMRAILEEDWGDFDVVTSFCSLYYLDESDMARVVRRAAELAPVMVLQAKTDTRAGAADDKARKSSLPFLERLLRENGFPEVQTVAPRGFTRPLLIGRREPDGH